MPNLKKTARNFIGSYGLALAGLGFLSGNAWNIYQNHADPEHSNTWLNIVAPPIFICSNLAYLLKKRRVGDGFNAIGAMGLCVGGFEENLVGVVATSAIGAVMNGRSAYFGNTETTEKTSNKAIILHDKFVQGAITAVGINAVNTADVAYKSINDVEISSAGSFYAWLGSSLVLLGASVINAQDKTAKQQTTAPV